MIYLITAIALLVYLLLAWLLGSWMHLAGSGLWILRAGLAVLGFAGATAVLWFRRDRQTVGAAAAQRTDIESEMDLLIRAAEARLSCGKLPHGTGLGTLPVALVIGLPGSAKTSIVANSGLDPELLAGTVLNDDAVAPTRSLNLWYAGGTVFAEAAGHILAHQKNWTAFVRRIAPARLRFVFHGGPQAPRVALVCFDVETLVNSRSDAAKQARQLRAKLGDVVQSLGVQLPVYVLFTRMDRLPYFTDFVSTLSRDESGHVLGSTLLWGGVSLGLYAQEQSALIEGSFHELFQSLAAARMELLSRESDELKAGCAYEFPREFRKLRAAVSEFLVELCRPSQFAVGPVLRGYYFSGVRPLIVEDLAPASVPVGQQAQAAADATGLFHPAALAEAHPAAIQPPRIVRRVAQWVFLSQFFRGVILEDRAAVAASGVSAPINTARRILLASAALVSFLLAIAFSVSWARNSFLESSALAAARALPVEPMRSDTPPLNLLWRLDDLRNSVETLVRYRDEGAPLSYRWGLYQGNAIYPELRRIYFDRFRALLFANTQASLADALRALPAKPGPDYAPVYDTLKAYLITTSNHDRSTRAFLAPVLLDRWSNGRGVDADRMALAAGQFAFYAEELKEENPYSTANDTSAVATARDYLAQFAGMERIYRAMLAEAAKANPAVEFNRRFPGSAAAVVDPYAVIGAFTKAGWQFMTAAVRNPARYFAGEQWVLENQQTAHLDAAQLEAQLRTRYLQDFSNAWRMYLKSASVVRYANLPDAARKLDLLAGNQSPLLALLALASENTAVDDTTTAGAFQPVHAVVPPAGAERFIAPPNQAYMSALLSLQSAVEEGARAGGAADAIAAPVLSAAGNARMAARQIAQGFKPDPAGQVDATVGKLLEDPITQVESLLRVLGPEALNGKGKALCSALRPVLSKYPFDRTANAEASLAEVNAAFRRPDGAVWTFYDGNLQKLVIRQGSQFVPNASATVHVTAEFLAFLNQVSALSDALYSDGAQDPHFTYNLKPVPAEGIQNLGLLLDGQALSYSGGAAVSKQFTWQGAGAHEARASVRFGSGPDLVWSNSHGLWAIFRFFDRAERWQPSGSQRGVEWTIRIGKDPVTLPNGKPLTVHLDLDLGNRPPILQRDYFRRLACVTQVAR